MQNTALALKYRPSNFDDGYIGQEYTAQMIKYGLDTNNLGKAILLSGERGCGKTSTARIIAKGTNCINLTTSKPCGICEFCKDDAMLIIEIDGASNRGVDEIRNIKESIKYISHPDKSKVYIIDEVHMMTKEAFNALLKTLEEPPQNVMFILCTTEPEKLPSTIISRVKHFKFSKIPLNLIEMHLKNVLQQEGFENYTNEAIFVIAEHANGGMRDALKLLDQCLLLNEQLTPENVFKVVGTINHTAYLNILKKISENNILETLQLVKDTMYQGVQPKYFYQNFIEVVLNVILKKAYIDSDKQLISEIKLSHDTLMQICDILQRDSKENLVELSIIKIMQLDNIKSIIFNPNHEVITATTDVTKQDNEDTQTVNKAVSKVNEIKDTIIHSALSYKVFQTAQSASMS